MGKIGALRATRGARGRVLPQLLALALSLALVVLAAVAAEACSPDTDIVILSAADAAAASAAACTTCRDLVITLADASTADAAPLALTLGALAGVTRDVLVNIGDRRHAVLSLPALASVARHVSVRARGRDCFVHELALPALTAVGGSLLVDAIEGHFGAVLVGSSAPGAALVVGGSLEIGTGSNAGASMGITASSVIPVPAALQAENTLVLVAQLQRVGMSLLIDGRAGDVGNVVINAAASPAALRLTVSGEVVIGTKSSTSGSLGNVTVRQAHSFGALEIQGRAGDASDVTVRSAPGATLAVTNQLLVGTGTSTQGRLGHVVVETVGSAASVSVETRASAVGDVTIAGAALVVPGAVQVSTGSSTSGRAGHVRITGLHGAQSLTVFAGGGDLAPVTINEPSAPCSALQISGDLVIQSGSSTAGSIESVAVYGIASIGQDLTVAAGGGTINNVRINNPELCPTATLAVFRDLTVSTGSSTQGRVDNVYIHGLSTARDLEVTAGGGRVRNLTITGAFALTRHLLLSAGSSSSARLSNIRLLGLRSVGDYASISTAAGDLEHIEILPPAGEVNGIPIASHLSFVGGSYSNGLITDLTLGPLATVGGNLEFRTGAATLQHITLLGRQPAGAAGATAGLLVAGKTTVTLGSYSAGRITDIRLTRVQSLLGDMVATTGGGQMRRWQIEGLPAGMTISGDVSFSTGSYRSGLFSGLVWSNLKTVTGDVFVDTRSGRAENFTFNAGSGAGSRPTLSVLGSIVFGSPSSNNHPGPFVFDNIKRVDGQIRIETRNKNFGGASLQAGFSFHGSVESGGLEVGQGVWIFTREQTEALPITFTALRSLLDANLVGLKAAYDAYLDDSPYVLGPVSINSRPVDDPVTLSAYSITALTDDRNCINYCRGRGMRPASADAQLPCSACDCFAGNTGEHCQDAPACTSCDCVCSPWSTWTTVNAEQGARTRSRSCAAAAPALACATVDLEGSVVCTPGASYEATAPTPTSHRVCTAYTVCNPATAYQTTAPTATSDRVCEALSICDPATSGTFQTQAPTSTTDRVCGTLTACSPGVNYETVPPTPTSDRVCEACRECLLGAATECTPTTNTVCIDCSACVEGSEFCDPFRPEAASAGACVSCTACVFPDSFEEYSCSTDGDTVCTAIRPPCLAGAEYETAAPTPTSDRMCESVAAACVTGLEFEASAPTATSDRVCAELRSCVPDAEYEASAPTPTSDRTCASLTVCRPGQATATEPGPSSDRTCEPCAPGTISPEAGADTCVPCPDNSYQPVMGAASCFPARLCTAGHGEEVAPTATTDRQCAPCELGTYSSSIASAEPCRPCAAGTYANTTQATKCTAVTACVGDGVGEVVAATPSSDRVCAVCSTGTFKSPTSGRCEACTGTCAGAGVSEYESVPCTSSTDRVCTAYSVDCPAGTFVVAGRTTTSDRICAPCLLGSTFSSTSNQAQCSPVRTCSTFETAAPTLIADRACSPDYCAVIGGCEHGGTCTNHVDGFTCVCSGVWSGQTCAVNSNLQCSNGACKNGGTCNDLAGGGYTCDCATGYAGGRCTELTCEHPDASCENGGVCVPTSVAGVPACDCPTGFSGPRCLEVAGAGTTTGSSSGGSSGSMAAVAGAAAGGVLLLALLLFAIYKRNHRNESVHVLGEDNTLAFANPSYSDSVPQRISPYDLVGNEGGGTRGYLEPKIGDSSSAWERANYAELAEVDEGASGQYEQAYAAIDQNNAYEVAVAGGPDGGPHSVRVDYAEARSGPAAHANDGNYDFASSAPGDELAEPQYSFATSSGRDGRMADYDLAGEYLVTTDDPDYDMASSGNAFADYDVASSGNAIVHYDLATTRRVPEEAPYCTASAAGGDYGSDCLPGAYDNLGSDGLPMDGP